MASVSVHDSRVYSRDKSVPHTVIVFDNPSLVNVFDQESFTKSLGLGERELQHIQAVSSTLTQATDSANKVDTHISVEGEKPVRVSAVVLPSACSRHNSPARPHALGAAIKDVKSSKNMTIFLVVSDEKHAFAQVCAVGRQFHVFSLKSNDHSDQQQIDVVVHFPPSAVNVEPVLKRSFLTVNNIRLAQRLVDSPPNILHTDQYVEDVRELSAMLNVSMEVIYGHELEERGFGGLWCVGKASEHLPALVLLSFKPEKVEEESSICLVGKGIVFDTGGLSVKTPSVNMVNMKTDMGGSAAVLGAFLTAVADGGLRRPLHALLCLAENSIGPLSTRPDDIIRLLSGKTVEINNIDAEGRLVLSDGVFYAHKNLNPAVIIDIATLTGAQQICTGKKHGAIYCSHETLEEQAMEAGKYSGDLVFPVVYVPEFYRQEFRSNVADMRNSVADRGNAQCSCAGQFIGNHLEEFLNAGKQWLHIDMAAPATVGDRATGYGVGLLFDLVCRLNN